MFYVQDSWFCFILCFIKKKKDEPSQEEKEEEKTEEEVEVCRKTSCMIKLSYVSMYLKIQMLQLITCKLICILAGATVIWYTSGWNAVAGKITRSNVILSPSPASMSLPKYNCNAACLILYANMSQTSL